MTQGTKTMTGASRWRLFPMAMLGSLGIVIAVNLVLAWAALSSNPGDAVADDFGTSNRYDQVLQTAAKQAALGWTIAASSETGHAVLTLSGPNAKPLAQASIQAVAQRPLGPKLSQPLAFIADPAAEGRYIADTILNTPGQWDLLLQIRVGDTITHATRRVIVR